MDDDFQELMEIAEHSRAYSRAFFDFDVKFQEAFAAHAPPDKNHVFHNAMIDVFISLAALHGMKLVIDEIKPDQQQAMLNEFKDKTLEAFTEIFSRFKGKSMYLKISRKEENDGS